MPLHRVKHLIIMIGFAVLLTGCRDTLDRWFHAETYEFSGFYSNQFNDDTMTFHDGVITLKIQQRVRHIPYSVDGDEIAIRFRQNSKEKRPDLIMRIHGAGEVLTCSACAIYQLSNVWVKDNQEVKNKRLK